MCKVRKKVQVLEEVKLLKRKYQPDILSLLETMTNEYNTQRTIRNMGFAHYDFVFLVNHSGGIWALWDNNHVHASVLTKDNRGIHMLIHDPYLAKNVLMSSVYGLAQA